MYSSELARFEVLHCREGQEERRDKVLLREFQLLYRLRSGIHLTSDHCEARHH